MTRPKYTNSPAAYDDCRRVMDIALNRPGLIYECVSPGQAVQFRQRCYKFRNLMRQLEYERNGAIPGLAVEVAYDRLTISYIRKEPHEKTSRFLQFKEKDVGKLIDPDTGEEITLTEYDNELPEEITIPNFVETEEDE